MAWQKIEYTKGHARRGITGQQGHPVITQEKNWGNKKGNIYTKEIYADISKRDLRGEIPGENLRTSPLSERGGVLGWGRREMNTFGEARGGGL